VTKFVSQVPTKAKELPVKLAKQNDTEPKLSASVISKKVQHGPAGQHVLAGMDLSAESDVAAAAPAEATNSAKADRAAVEATEAGTEPDPKPTSHASATSKKEPPGTEKQELKAKEY